VQRLALRFVTVADEVGRLQRGKDPECLFFQTMAEQGHYKGRTTPTNTRQGIYAFAPSGAFLASINTRGAREMAKMLESALDKWKSLSREERLGASDPRAVASAVRRYEGLFPEGGLALRVTTRDLPREDETRKDRRRDWRAQAWNQDTAWFKKEEAREFLPPLSGDATSLKPGERHAVPKPIVTRLVRAHLIDNVRGQTTSYDEADVITAELSSVVESVADGRVTIRLEGTTRAAKKGTWPVDGFKDMNAPKENERGFESALLGHAEFDLEAGRFVAFELVAKGSRWGATQYNGREDDLGPAPIGVVFAQDESAAAVAPSWHWIYGWR
jgi:hypothetical protein